MRFKDVFSIIGPAMIGPSSSHTAGAVRIGRVARQLLGECPDKADIQFYGSFAETYQGHGTDVAIVGGLLDFETDDPRIARSLEIAASIGLEVAFREGKGAAPHPNTAVVRLNAGKAVVEMTGCSIGGGNIEVLKVDGFDVKLTGIYPTVVLYHRDRPGVIAEIAHVLAEESINIGHMAVDRKSRSGEAMTVIEMDQAVSDDVLDKLTSLPDVAKAKRINLNAEA